MDEGQRATWPRIERIRIQTRISRTLDPILHQFEDQHIAQFGNARRTRKARTTRRKAS